MLQNYENILKKDGWTIYEDKKPNSIAAKKDAHQVALVPTTWGIRCTISYYIKIG